MDLAKIRKKASRKMSVKDARDQKKGRLEEVPVPEEPAMAEPAAAPEPRQPEPVPPPGMTSPTPAPRKAAAEKPVEPADLETVSVTIENVPQQSEDTAQADKERKLEKLLVFKVGRNRYAMPIGDLSQIIEDRGLTPLPFVPPFLKGIFSLRGHIVGVIDVAARLNLSRQEEAAARKIIVLEKGGDLFGLKVDGIEHVVEVDTLSLEAPPESFEAVGQEFVLGVFHYKKRTVAFLNLDQFLNFEITWRN